MSLGSDLNGAWNWAKNEASGLKNTLEGDPNALTAGLSQLQQTAIQNGQQIKNFLLGREGNAEQYLQPMRQMFASMYGTGGMRAPVAPGVPTGGAPGGIR